MEVAAVDQRDLDRHPAQLVHRLQPAEAAADDHDALARRQRLPRRPRAPDQQHRRDHDHERDGEAEEGGEQVVHRRAPSLARAAQRALDDLLRLGDHALEVVLAPEALGVDLVDVLGAGRARREPAALGDDLEAADLGVVARRRVSTAVIGSPASSEESTWSSESFLSTAFSSGVAATSVRL